MKSLLVLVVAGLMASALGAQMGSGGGGGGSTGPSGPSTPVGSMHFPVLEVSYIHATGRMQIGHMSTVTIPHGESVVSLGFELKAQDGDADPVQLTASITNTTVTGVVESEWSSSSAAVPYTLSPTSGQFNAPGGQTIVFAFTAHDGLLTSDFSFTLVQLPAAPNNAPVVTLEESSTGVVRAVAHGGVLVVPYGFRVADFAFRLRVVDADGDDVSLSAVHMGDAGIVLSEWESSSQPAPFTLMPTSGVLEDVDGGVDQIALTADDGTDQTTFVFEIRQEEQASVTSGSSGGAGGCTGRHGSTAFAALALFGVVVLLQRRRTA